MIEVTGADKQASALGGALLGAAVGGGTAAIASGEENRLRNSLLGAAGGATAGGLMGRRYARLVGAPANRLEEAKRHFATHIRQDLQPGDILTRTFDDQKATGWYDKLPLGKKMRVAMHNVPSTLLAGKGSHSSLYVGRGKVLHYYPPERGGYQLHDIDSNLIAGSYVTRPNLPKKERAAAARRGRDFLATDPKTPQYGTARSVQAGLNKLLPISGVCGPNGDSQLCSGFISDLYEGKLTPKGVASHLVTPTDLAGLEGAQIRRVR